MSWDKRYFCSAVDRKELNHSAAKSVFPAPLQPQPDGQGQCSDCNWAEVNNLTYPGCYKLKVNKTILIFIVTKVVLILNATIFFFFFFFFFFFLNSSGIIKLDSFTDFRPLFLSSLPSQ